MVAQDFCLYLLMFLLFFPVKLASGSTTSSGIKDVAQSPSNTDMPGTVDGGTRNTDDMPGTVDGGTRNTDDMPGTVDGGTRLRGIMPGNNGRTRNRDDMPDDDASGGTRGRCLQDPEEKPELTLLIPNNGEGLTVAKSPTFFVFVSQTNAKKGEFLLYDRTEKKLIYRTIFELTGLPGITRIQLPNNQEYLKINHDYEWRFSLHCKPNDDRSEDVTKKGLIRRVVANEAIAKIQGTPNSLEKARVYQQSNLWYDALKIVAELSPTTGKNSNAAALWQELLQAGNLKEIVSYPLIDCCKSTN